MSLLKEITQDATDDKVSVTVLLRKCMILASKLGNADFMAWVEHELEGYSSTEELPKYRVMKAESHGDFISPGWQMTNVLIRPAAIPSECREFAATVYFMDPIKNYESLALECKESGIMAAWPAELLHLIDGKVYSGASCSRAWRYIPKTKIDALIDTVRNRVLKFALAIEAEAPEAGEAPPNSKPIADDRVSQFFITNIQGNVASLNAGGKIFGQDIKITVNQNDLESLNKFLSSLGIGKPDLGDLADAIAQDAQSGNKDKPGSKVTSWIGKIICKAADGALNVATTVAAQVITEAFKRYYGAPPLA